MSFKDTGARPASLTLYLSFCWPLGCFKLVSAHMYYTCNVSSEVSEAFSEQNTIKNKTLFFLALICPYTNTVSTCIKDSSSFSSHKIFYAQTRHISVKEIYYSRCHSWTVINKCVPTFSFKEKNSNLASLWGAGIRER